MNNKKNYDILKKSFDVSSDSVVNLKARVNIDNKKKSDFSDKQDKDTQEFKTEASMIKNLENTTKNISKRNISKDDNNSANVKSNYFLRYFFYFLVFFLPLFFLPFSMEIFEFNKTLLLFVVSSLAFLVWMVKMIIIDRRIVFVKTPLDVPIIIFIFLVLLSTVLSVDKVSSVLGFYGRFSDSLMVYLSLAMLYFVGVNSVVFRQVQDDNQQICDDSKNFTNNLIKTFLVSSFVVIIVSLLYSLGIKLIPLNETQFNSFNLVSGSFNILGIYLVSVIIIAFYYLLENKNALVKCLVYLLITMSLILLAIIDFVVAWVVLAVSLLLALILSFIVRRHGENAVSARHCLVPAGLIILISFAFIATSLTCMNNNIESNFESSSMSSSIKDRIAPSVDNGQIEDGKRFIKEVILDKETAIYITVEGIKEDPIIGIVGTGPGTYLYNFSKFKPVEFNNNIYWNIRFDKAGSEIIEKISTIGILGVLSYLLIMVLVVGMFLKALRKVRNNNFIYLFSAWFSLLLFQFLYIESMTTKFVFWMLTIILVVKCYSFRTQDAEENILWEFKIRRSNCIFYLSLLLVIIASITISYYYQIRFYQAETAYKNVVFAYDRAMKDTSLNKQNAWEVLDKSVEDLNRVIEKNPYNGNYKSFLSDIYFNRLTIVIQEENKKSEEERNDQKIAQEMKNMVDHMKSVADANSNNIIFQQKLGDVYAFMFNNIKIANVDKWVIKKYKRAISLEPTNPILHTELGKVYVSQYLESSAEDKINDAINEFEKALELKNNYSDAGLQLGLVYEIKGDNEKAISQLNSFIKNGTADINIVVQLGRIQYNSGNINKAKNIFLEIIRLQPRNLNAHYSLGLIYEKEENYKDALREFEAVFLLNSDNKKVVEKIDKLKKLIEEKSKEPEPEPEPEPVVEWGSVEDEMEEE